MKKLRWRILAPVILFGAIIAVSCALLLVDSPEEEPLTLAMVGLTNDVSGDASVLLKVTNQSNERFVVALYSEALIGGKWQMDFSNEVKSPTARVSRRQELAIPA